MNLAIDFLAIAISGVLALIGIKVLFSGFDDDDDDGGGMGTPIFEPMLVGANWKRLKETH